MARIVAALGGNALGNTPPEQRARAAEAAKTLAELIEQGNEIVVAHGNGPQVGMINLALGSAAEQGLIPAELPFPECGAMSQGYIGFHLQNALRSRSLAAAEPSSARQNFPLPLRFPHARKTAPDGKILPHPNRTHFVELRFGRKSVSSLSEKSATTSLTAGALKKRGN